MPLRLSLLTIRQNWHYLPLGIKLSVYTASMVVVVGTPATVMWHKQHDPATPTQTAQITTKTSASGSSFTVSSSAGATTQPDKSTGNQPGSNASSSKPAPGSKSTTTSGSKTSAPPSSGSTTPPGSNSGTTPTPSGYPSASTTGPSGCSSYTVASGTYTITTAGTVVNCLKLTGTLDVEASNVTVKNSILTGTSWWGVRMGVTNASTTGLKLLNDKLQTVAGQGPDNGGYDYGVAPQSADSIEVGYCDISGYKDGVDISTGSIHDSYIHNLSNFSGAHTQDVYVYAGGSGVQISNNTLINDTPISVASAAVYIAPDDGHQNNVSVIGNQLAGGALTLYGGDATATNIVVKNNVFSTTIFANSGYYGTDGYWHPNNAGNIWSGNTWLDGPHAGQTVDP
jgi:hypothetical protein